MAAFPEDLLRNQKCDRELITKLIQYVLNIHTDSNVSKDTKITVHTRITCPKTTLINQTSKSTHKDVIIHQFYYVPHYPSILPLVPLCSPGWCEEMQGILLF